jgi:hypothetical protein
MKRKRIKHNKEFVPYRLPMSYVEKLKRAATVLSKKGYDRSETKKLIQDSLNNPTYDDLFIEDMLDYFGDE